VIDTKTDESTVLDNSRNLHAAQGAGIQTAKKVAKEVVDAVLTGHVGPKAQEALEAARVKVFLGASGTVKDALGALKSGQLGTVSKISGCPGKEEFQMPGREKRLGRGQGRGRGRRQ
jgi:predicted Fe-Mo cluster-binding NifX family protein